MTHSICALRVYFFADSEAEDDFVTSPPSPWRTNGHERCKIAFLNTRHFKDGWSAVFLAEDLGEHKSVDELQDALLGALKKAQITSCVVEDLLSLKADRDSLDKIKTGLEKSQSDPHSGEE